MAKWGYEMDSGNGHFLEFTAPIEGRKDDSGKARYDLIPPELPDAVAQVLAFGAAKYTVEVKNEWDALLLAQNVMEVRVTTQKGSVVVVTRNTSDSPIPSMQNANVKIVETGKKETLKKSLSWQNAEEVILKFVKETPIQNGQTVSARSVSPILSMPSSALLDAPYADQGDTCMLTIVTKQGNSEVFFAPDAIMDSGFWTTQWRDLNVRFGISRPQNTTGERNWEKGMKWGRPFAALMRHMWSWWRGEKVDEETGMSHLWHACACLSFLIAFEARNTGTDDRP